MYSDIMIWIWNRLQPCLKKSMFQESIEVDHVSIWKSTEFEAYCCFERSTGILNRSILRPIDPSMRIWFPLPVSDWNPEPDLLFLVDVMLDPNPMQRTIANLDPETHPSYKKGSRFRYTMVPPWAELLYLPTWAGF